MIESTQTTSPIFSAQNSETTSEAAQSSDTLWTRLGLDKLFAWIGEFFSWITQGLFSPSESFKPTLSSFGASFSKTENGVQFIENDIHPKVTDSNVTIDEDVVRAIKEGDEDSLTSILEKSTDFNIAVDGSVLTPIAFAVLCGKPNSLKKLISKGLNVDLIFIDATQKKINPLSLAIQCYNSLVSEKASETDKDNYKEIIKILLESGANIHAPIYGLKLQDSWFESSESSSLKLAKALNLPEITELLEAEYFRFTMECYQTLGISCTTKTEEIESAYKEKCEHISRNDPKFQTLRKAYDQLIKRKTNLDSSMNA